LLRVSQITTQELRFHKQSKMAARVDVCDIVDSVLALFRGRLAGKKIAVSLECERGAFTTCFGDEIRQVVANLVSNALDATSEGRLRVRVRRTRSWTKGLWVEGVKLVVADTGQGIPAVVVEHIFEPFVTTRRLRGLGWGCGCRRGLCANTGDGFGCGVKARDAARERCSRSFCRRRLGRKEVSWGGVGIGRSRDGAELALRRRVAWVRDPMGKIVVDFEDEELREPVGGGLVGDEGG